MALSFERPWALALWPLLAGLLLLMALRLGRRGWRGLLLWGLRLVMVTLLVLGAAGPGRAAVATEQHRLVVLVDESASVDALSLAELQQSLRDSGQGAEDLVVVPFTTEPRVLGDWQDAWPPAEDRAAGTNLERALDFGGHLLAAGAQGGRLLLASDGQATAGDALAAAQRLALNGVAVDVWPLRPAAGPADVAVEAVSMPGALWAGEPFSLTVQLYAQAATTATLAVRRDGADFAQLPLDLEPGDNQVSLSADADAEGLTAFEARVSAPGDTQPENDFGGAVGLVRPPPSALIVASQPDKAAALQAALAQHQVRVQIVDPSRLPADAGGLLDYQVVIAMDLPASALTLEQQAALEALVYTRGHGLIFTGGPSSYALGGYQATALEHLLPVTLEPPERAERPPARLLLIIDHSGSMSGLKLDLVKEAAMRAVEILQPSDHVGVLAFDDRFEWRVPLAELGQGAALRQVLDQIGTLTAGGGTNMLAPLEVGVEAMAALPGSNKHVVLLGDGMSATGSPSEFRRAVEAGLASGVTVSAIAIGTNADAPLMANIAEWGHGRFHEATTAESLPRLLLAESQAVRSEAVQQGTVQPQIVRPHPLVSGFQAADFPPLEAYEALTPRPAADADVALSSPLGDPLLAAWQYGLGRVVAWTSDVGGDWAPAWSNWPGLSQFWSQAVRYALPDPSQGPLFAEARTDGNTVALNALAAGDDGKGVNLAAAALTFASPDGTRSTVDLSQTAPGEYSTTFTAPQPGAYRGLVTLNKDGRRWEAPVGFVVSYSPEYRAARASGDAALAQIAAVTGGHLVSELPAPRAAASVPAATAGPEPGLWLVLAALVLWPVEIAIRRRWMPWK